MKDYKNKCIDCQCKVDNRTKRCHSCYDKWRENTKDERKAISKQYQKDWYIANRAMRIAKAKENRKTLTKEKKKSWAIKHKYGVTIEEYKDMLIKCNYRCQICEASHSEEKPLHIDHCHKTGKVRGLLCNKCNHGLGFFKDQELLLTNAIKYLKYV